MNANWLVTLERKSVVQNDFGEEVETWLPLVSDLFARKRDVSDGERVAAAEVAASITTRFVVPWASEYEDLSPLDRLIHNDRTYDISAVKELGYRQDMEISAAARAE
jgi:SPP1 family predicted phage head-tail adaptor